MFPALAEVPWSQRTAWSPQEAQTLVQLPRPVGMETRKPISFPFDQLLLVHPQVLPLFPAHSDSLREDFVETPRTVTGGP